MKRHLLLAAITAMACVWGAEAQSISQARVDSLKASHKVIQFGSGEEAPADSVQKLIDEFYYDQFRNSQDPDAPTFIFMSKKANMAMGIGGRLVARGWYDWDYDTNDGFVTSDIPMTPDPAQRHALNGNVAGSRLFFKVLGNAKKLGNYQAYLEAKFNGSPNGKNFKLSKAYATLNDWTLGLANSTFEDGAAQPFTVDSQGPNSETSDTDLLVRYMHKFNKNCVVAASVEMPDVDGPDATAYYKPASQSAPNIAAFYQYQWGEDEHIRFSGIMRFMKYRDLVSLENNTQLGWGVKASSVFRPAQGPVTVYLNAVYGKGIASLTNDLGGLGLDLLATPDQPGKMYAPAAFGYYGGVQYDFSPSVFASASFSEMRFLPGHEVTPDTYRYGLYGAVNVCWYVTPRILVGAEFDLGAHKTFSMDSKCAHRAGIIAQMSF